MQWESFLICWLAMQLRWPLQNEMGILRYGTTRSAGDRVTKKQLNDILR
jgi:hypothetical protein